MVQQNTDTLEATFVSLVKKSWQTHEVFSWNNSVDEILIGAVINATLEKGYLLIDIKSERAYSYSSADSDDSDSTFSAHGLFAPVSSHFLRFEKVDDGSRLLYELNRITKELAEAKVLGQLCKVTIGYGEKAKNFGQVMDIMKQEFKSNFVDTSEPGIISFDADASSGYIYAKVPIIINISEYAKDNNIADIDYEKLHSHIEAVVHSLKKYLRGRNLV